MHATDSSCPALCLISTSLQLHDKKTWMVGMNPAMTRKQCNDRTSRYPVTHRHPLALRRWHQRLAHACAGGGLRNEGTAMRAAVARLSRTGVQLAQGDADAGRGRLPRDRAGSAWLRPYHRLECRL